MLQIAHRGHSHFFKDNSEKAIKDAIKNNFDFIEMDICLTRDNKIIIKHDVFIEDKLVEELSYEEIIKKDKDILLLDNLFDINFADCKIYLDVKGTSKITKYLNELLHNKNLKNIYLASFNTIILDELYNYNKNYNIGLITDNNFDSIILRYYINKYNLKFICFNWNVLEENTINFLKKNNVKVFTYTCNNNTVLEYMKRYEIDGIVTNYKLN